MCQKMLVARHRTRSHNVVPAKAGTQAGRGAGQLPLDSRFRGNDGRTTIDNLIGDELWYCARWLDCSHRNARRLNIRGSDSVTLRLGLHPSSAAAKGERGNSAMPMNHKNRKEPGAKKAPAKPSSSRGSADAQVLSYRHGDRRKNNPEVGMVDPDTDPAQPKTTVGLRPAHRSGAAVRRRPRAGREADRRCAGQRRPGRDASRRSSS